MESLQGNQSDTNSVDFARVVYILKGMRTAAIVNLLALMFLISAMRKDKRGTGKALRIALASFIRILPVILIIIVLIGLLMGFVPKEKICTFKKRNKFYHCDSHRVTHGGDTVRKKENPKDIVALIVVLALAGVLLVVFPEKRKPVLLTSWNFFKEMIAILPAVMILMGLFAVFVPKEMVLKYLGKTSGIRGIALALFCNPYGVYYRKSNSLKSLDKTFSYDIIKP